MIPFLVGSLERKKDMERIVRIAVIQLGLESVVYRDNESSVYGSGWNSLNMIRLFRKYAFLAGSN